MDNKNLKICPHNCYWYEQCHCKKICEDFTPIISSDDDISDDLLKKHKYEYREEIFEILEEEEYFDN